MSFYIVELGNLLLPLPKNRKQPLHDRRACKPKYFDFCNVRYTYCTYRQYTGLGGIDGLTTDPHTAQHRSVSSTEYTQITRANTKKEDCLVDS